MTLTLRVEKVFVSSRDRRWCVMREVRPIQVSRIITQDCVTVRLKVVMVSCMWGMLQTIQI